VHRIGQTKKTEIFRFVSTGSIEEIIYNRQIYKQQMANIGTQGSHERRFFKGVQGRRGEEGELFGLGTERQMYSHENRFNYSRFSFRSQLAEIREG
jgi:DNA excision repair protein ERCC-6-like 2